jgi:flagellar hook assembly protein FlgD
VEVEFTTRLFANATVFSLDLGSSKRPGLWQSVEAAQRRADVVLVPELASNSRLIGDLQLSTQTLTPNGDGVNDQLEISLVVFKVDGQAPRVRLYDLAGRLVNALEATGQGRQIFRWSGRDLQGQLVQPGLYLMNVELEAEAGAQVQTRTIAVAY